VVEEVAAGSGGHCEEASEEVCGAPGAGERGITEVEGEEGVCVRGRHDGGAAVR
jgi:hypothetical protein